MKNDPLPHGDHVLRLVGGSYVDKDEAGNPAIQGGGFIAKPKDNNQPSYNWMECFDAPRENQLSEIRSRSRLTYNKTARLVLLNIGQVCQHVRDNTDDNHRVVVLHDPLDAEGTFPADPSHAVMANVPDQDDPHGELIGDLIAQCVLEVFSARES